MAQKEIPCYLFVGMLESGKTKFIQETMEDPQFDSGDKTLLLICEEGEEEYDSERFAFGGVTVATIEDKAELNREHLQQLAEKSDCGRVIIEYNGMWLVQELYDALPDNWLIYQCLATADGTTIKTYANDNAMRGLLLDKLRGSELLVVNRAEAVNDDESHQLIHKLVRQASRRCDIAYEFKDGSVAYDDIPDPLPFDVNAPVIEIPEEFFGVWYMDCMDEMQKYDGKTVKFLAQVCQTNRAGKNSFVLLRHDLLCAGHPVCGLPLQLRRLQGAGAAQLGHRDRQGGLQVPQHLPRQRPRAHRSVGGAGPEATERSRNVLLTIQPHKEVLA